MRSIFLQAYFWKAPVPCGCQKQDSASHFHGKKDKDYAGRSWLEPPKGLKPENEFCYLPKRWIHTWSGHTKVRARNQPAAQNVQDCVL